MPSASAGSNRASPISAAAPRYVSDSRMRSSVAGSGALTVRRARDASSLVRPTWKSSTSNSPPPSTMRSNVFRRMSESIRWPSMLTVSWTMGSLALLHLRQRQPVLLLVLALLVRVRDLAGLVALEEQHLRDALVRVDLGGQRGRVRDLQRDDALPLGLQRRHVHDDAAARVGRLAQADDQHVARDAEVL